MIRTLTLPGKNPSDYIEVFFKSLRSALKKASKVAGFHPSRVIGIGIDTTGSTPIPIAKNGTPLGMLQKFKSNLNAHAWLWKDHTSHEEAAEITQKSQASGVPYLSKCGGTYSSEWFWSKIWHCQRVAPEVFSEAYSWVELADFVPAYITGNLTPSKIIRGICAAGHKAMFSDTWGGLPDRKFLSSLSPQLAGLRNRLYERAVPSDQTAGLLTNNVARKVGLPTGIPVAVGAFDAHMGAVGSGVKPGTLVKIIGTSTCDIMAVPQRRSIPDIPGLCGIVPGSVIPGMTGLEAGQSAVGDIFNWFVTQLCPSTYANGNPHYRLTKEGEKLRPGESGIMALDWNNGNRTILVDPLLSGLLIGQTLHTTAPEIYRALIEATAFGALTIIRRLEEYGVKVKEVINCGGIAEKNPFVMQIYADVCNRPMKISRSSESCALGAAVFGAVVGGAYRNTREAQRSMTGIKSQEFRPRKTRSVIYGKLYAIYQTLHDAFGTSCFTGNLERAMKDLIEIRDQVRKK